MRKAYGGTMLVAAALLAGVCGARAEAPGGKGSPETGHLKQLVGTWEATVEIPGGPTIKGTMVYKMEMGDHWLVGRFKSEEGIGGMPFEGTGLDSYDPAHKRLVSVWVDSMSNSPMVMHGTYDEATHTITMTGKGPGPDGKMVDMKSVLKAEGKDKMTFTLSGQEGPPMVIHYKRKS